MATADFFARCHPLCLDFWEHWRKSRSSITIRILEICVLFKPNRIFCHVPSDYTHSGVCQSMAVVSSKMRHFGASYYRIVAGQWVTHNGNKFLSLPVPWKILMHALLLTPFYLANRLASIAEESKMLRGFRLGSESISDSQSVRSRIPKSRCIDPYLSWVILLRPLFEDWRLKAKISFMLWSNPSTRRFLNAIVYLLICKNLNLQWRKLRF